jgi:hypothetical protein
VEQLRHVRGRSLGRGRVQDGRSAHLRRRPLNVRPVRGRLLEAAAAAPGPRGRRAAGADF